MDRKAAFEAQHDLSVSGCGVVAFGSIAVAFSAPSPPQSTLARRPRDQNQLGLHRRKSQNHSLPRTKKKNLAELSCSLIKKKKRCMHVYICDDTSHSCVLFPCVTCVSRGRCCFCYYCSASRSDPAPPSQSTVSRLYRNILTMATRGTKKTSSSEFNVWGS